MTIGSAAQTAALSAAAPSAAPSDTQQQVSLAMLKKIMDSQADMTERLLASGSPKGQLIDIRA